MCFAKTLVRQIQAILYNPRLEDEVNGITRGITTCNKAVRAINLAISKSTSVEKKRRLSVSLGQVQSFRKIFKALRAATGSGYRGMGKHLVAWENSTSAFSTHMRTGVITNLLHTDPKLFLEDCEALFGRRMKITLKKEKTLKVNAVFCGEFTILKAGMVIEELKYFKTKSVPIYRGANLKARFAENIQRPLLMELEEFLENSGWAFGAILNLQVHINKFTPKLGSSYIPLSKQIAKRSIVDRENHPGRVSGEFSLATPPLSPMPMGNAFELNQPSDDYDDNVGDKEENDNVVYITIEDIIDVNSDIIDLTMDDDVTLHRPSVICWAGRQ